MNCLRVERLLFERDDLPILQNVNLDIQSGDIVQLAGQNGSGKTTLLRILAGLVSPTSGLASWNGGELHSHDFQSALMFLGHQVGVKLTMTPLENTQWWLGVHGSKCPADPADSSKLVDTPNNHTIEAALKRVQLGAYLNTPCYQLSAGQQRRVALARLYLSKAPLWLLDEPFTAIDKEGVTDLEQQIEHHAAGGGMVVLTTHQAWNADKIRVIQLEQFQPKRARYA